MKALHVFIILIVIKICSSCYYIPSSECPSNEDKCRCARRGPNNATVICCSITSEFLFKESRTCVGLLTTHTEHVYIYNTSLEYFDAGIPEWYNLTSLTFTNGSIKINIQGEFQGNLECVNLSSNSLININSTAFKKLNKLTVLDLSKNNITKVPDLPIEKSKSFTIDISDNRKIECHYLMDLFGVRGQLKFNNRNSTSCLRSQSFHWFNSTTPVSLEQLELLQRLQKECPRGINYQCNCSSIRFELIEGKPATFSFKVDCSGQNLTELPPKLPLNTILLDVSNNNITSLDLLISESTYSDIRMLLADNNKITSITSLERSQFIDKFVTLSIRRNELKSIPIYILSNTFDRNWEGRIVKLGGNKLNCDCNTAQVLKLWLLANKAHIPDYEDVLCEKDLEKVINLDQNKVCVYQKDWTDYIYYIIAAEIILLLFLISKVTYDYWVFKTSGYLPWPASKMPKLPCDWFFET